MHELSIALSLIELAEEEVQRQGGGRVCAVYLKLGPEGTALAGSQLIVEDIPIRIYCMNCADEGDPMSDQCLHCARCGGSACRVVKGAELELSALELQT